MTFPFNVTNQSCVQSITIAFFSAKKKDIATSTLSGIVTGPEPASKRTSASYRWLSSQKSMLPSTHWFAAVMSWRSWLPRVVTPGVPPPLGAASARYAIPPTTLEATNNNARPTVRSDGFLISLVDRLSRISFVETSPGKERTTPPKTRCRFVPLRLNYTRLGLLPLYGADFARERDVLGCEKTSSSDRQSLQDCWRLTKTIWGLA